jgi:GH3 auxin-responsive promoter
MTVAYSDLHDRWMSACRASFARFTAATGRCREAQEAVLKAITTQNAETTYGRQHQFISIRSIDNFREYVPIATYDDLQPYIDRLRQGKLNELTSEAVTTLHLTSGTSQGSKMVPFTNGLREGFQAGIQPWLYDLYLRYPRLKNGPFFWIVTPAGIPATSEESAVPIGFANDSEYLDFAGRDIFPRVSIGSATASCAISPQEFYLSTWMALLANRNLSMISFWSPRFFLELLRHLPQCAEAALQHIYSKGLRDRTRELEQLFEFGFDTQGLGRHLWPGLAVVSCWTNGWASLFMKDIRRFFDGVPLQGKGLLATEGIVSFPLGDQPGSVLAVNSHFFEFETPTGCHLVADELTTGREYQVILTTQGGLYRYRLGDIIRVVGWERDIPRVEFVSKSGRVVDLCGEKLNEAFVDRIFSHALLRLGYTPGVCFLAPAISGKSAGYVLVLDDSYAADVANLRDEVERGLQENFYYRHGRQLGQLSALEVRRLDRSMAEFYRRKSGQWSTTKLSFLETKSVPPIC